MARLCDRCLLPAVRGNARLCVEDEAMALEAEHRRQRQPSRCEARPRTHGDHHRVALDRLAADLDAAHAGAAGVARNAGDLADAEAGAPGLGGAHHGGGECARMHLRGGVDGAEAPVDGYVIRYPGNLRLARGAHAGGCIGVAAIGRHAAIAPVATELIVQAGMQREAAPSQCFERPAVAPVERKKPAGLARRAAGQPGALDDDHLGAQTTQEVGDRRADHAAAADQDAHRVAPHCPLSPYFTGRGLG